MTGVTTTTTAGRAGAGQTEGGPAGAEAAAGAGGSGASPDATDAEVWEAVVASGLEATIAGKPDGLETLLGDHGAGLSTGERQRVALARSASW